MVKQGRAARYRAQGLSIVCFFTRELTIRHPQAHKQKAPGFAGGWLQFVPVNLTLPLRTVGGVILCDMIFREANPRAW